MTWLGAIGVFASIAIATQGGWLQQQMAHSARQAFVAKDVVADILPPPLYLIELRLLLSMAVEGTVTPTEARKQFDALASDYAKRVAYWSSNPPQDLETKLLGAQHTAGQRFIEVARSQVIDALLDGRAELARAQLPAVHAVDRKSVV